MTDDPTDSSGEELHDLTARHEAERDLKAARDLLDKFIQQSPVPTWISGPDGTMTVANRALKETLHLTDEQLIGRYNVLNDRNLDEQGLMGQIRAVFDELRPAQIELTWSGGKVDGADLVAAKETVIRATLFPIVDEDGELKNVVCQWLDVSERKKLEQQLIQSQKLEAIGRLAGGIAHDFNNLLTVINSYAFLAKSELPAAHRGRAHLDQIMKAGDRAAALTGHLLAFSRKQVLQPRVLDLNGVVTALEPMLERLIGEDIDLQVLPAQGLEKVLADPGQIELVLMNLVINARDAMPDGGNITIETGNVVLDDSATRSHVDANPGPHVVLAVSDSGEGMSSEVKALIFEPFFTTKAQGKGTGLGLATVYGIVKQSGGMIWVYSEPGIGSAFKIYLPVATPADAASATPVAVAPPQARVVLQATETVLLVEDDPSVRSLVFEILSSSGYTVLTAADPDDALSYCERHPGRIDLMLTDVVMPRMSGTALASRAHAHRPALEVLYMSGYTDNAIVHHGVLDPGTHFIPKPFSPEQLLVAVRGVLESRG